MSSGSVLLRSNLGPFDASDYILLHCFVHKLDYSKERLCTGAVYFGSNIKSLMSKSCRDRTVLKSCHDRTVLKRL